MVIEKFYKLYNNIKRERGYIYWIDVYQNGTDYAGNPVKYVGFWRSKKDGTLAEIVHKTNLLIKPPDLWVYFLDAENDISRMLLAEASKHLTEFYLPKKVVLVPVRRKAGSTL